MPGIMNNSYGVDADTKTHVFFITWVSSSRLSYMFAERLRRIGVEGTPSVKNPYIKSMYKYIYLYTYLYIFIVVSRITRYILIR